MAAGPLGMPSVNRFGQTLAFDVRGRPILTITSRQFTVMEPNGTVSVHEEDEWIQLVDHVMWSPSLLAGPHPVLLAVCEACRKPPVSSHGCLSVRNCRVCVDCGTGTCARHRKLIDGHWRCLTCTRGYRIKNFLRSLFFSSDA